MPGIVSILGRGARLVALLVPLLLAACAQLVPQTVALRDDWPAGVPRQVELSAVPCIAQEAYQCGPAALAMVLRHSGMPVSADALVNEVWLPARKGSLQLEMLATPRRHGRVSFRLAPRYADLLREVAAGHPVVVLQDVGLLLPQWHYAVVNGFDYASGSIFLRSGTTERLEMPFTAFERTWLQGDYWAMVVLPPQEIAVTATESQWLEALSGLARGGDHDAAVAGYTAALRRWPDSLPIAIGLANQLHMRGSLDRAVALLRDTLRRNQQSAVVMNNLAQTLSDLGRNKEALALIDRAADSDTPFASEVRSTRQLIRQRLGQR